MERQVDDMGKKPEENIGKRVQINDPYSIRYQEYGTITEYRKGTNSYFVVLEDERETLEVFNIGQVKVLK